MDRISALRNIEAALSAFERGEIDLETAERRVRGVMRTYATEFEGDRRAVYRVELEDGSAPVVLVAESPADARERAREVDGGTPTRVDRLSDGG